MNFNRALSPPQGSPAMSLQHMKEALGLDIVVFMAIREDFRTQWRRAQLWSEQETKQREDQCLLAATRGATNLQPSEKWQTTGVEGQFVTTGEEIRKKKDQGLLAHASWLKCMIAMREGNGNKLSGWIEPLHSGLDQA